MEQRFKPGDSVRVRSDYYPKNFDTSLIHIIRAQTHGDRFAVHCISMVVWQDLIESVGEPATCMLCLAYEGGGVTTLDEDLGIATNRLAAASGIPLNTLFARKKL